MQPFRRNLTHLHDRRWCISQRERWMDGERGVVGEGAALNYSFLVHRMNKCIRTPVLCYLSRVWYLCMLKVIIWRCPAYARVPCRRMALDRLILSLHKAMNFNKISRFSHATTRPIYPGLVWKTCRRVNNKEPGPRVCSLNWTGFFFLDVLPHRADVSARLFFSARLQVKVFLNQHPAAALACSGSESLLMIVLFFKTWGKEAHTHTLSTVVDWVFLKFSSDFYFYLKAFSHQYCPQLGYLGTHSQLLYSIRYCETEFIRFSPILTETELKERISLVCTMVCTVF